VVQRAIDKWIDAKKQSVTKKSGPRWGALVHGNRILAAATFRDYGDANLSQSIAGFAASFKESDVDGFLEKCYTKMVAAIEAHYAGKFLAVLFKNPTMSKHVFDLSVQ
jgi:hypothetical protein